MSLSRRSFLCRAAAVCASGATNPLGCIPALASVSTSLAESDRAVSRRLDAGWEFYAGPLDPRFQVWHSEELLTWAPVTLPHCFNHRDACDPDTPAYRGPGWYRIGLDLANPFPQGRTLLHFEAAGQAAQVYVGDKRIAEHKGGYDEFLVDITEAAGTSRSIQLSVRCDNGRDIDRMPSDLSDFTLYGGLYRPVHLVYVPPVSLEAVHTHVVCAADLEAAEVSVTARLYAPIAPVGPMTLRVRLLGPDSQVLLDRTLSRGSWLGETELVTCTITRPRCWSPALPQLYRCEVTLGTGVMSTSSSHLFGVRHTRFQEHGPFFLNGERLLLRGTQRHEDHAGYAAAMPDDVIRQEMQLVKEMGANFIRLAHYQQSRLVLELCDQLGLLVWEEVPWCRSGVVSDTFRQQGTTLLTRMIDQHRNHPSILLWGLGNEDDWPTEPQGNDHAAIRQYMIELRDLAHRLDDTRLTSFRRADFASDIPDVYSPSIWAGWYSGSYREYGAALEKARYSVPHLLHAEWGADSHAGRHAEDPDPAMKVVRTGTGVAETGFDYKLAGGEQRMSRDGEWSETYACELFDWYLKTSEQIPWLTGSAQWIFKDFTTPLRVDNPIPRVNQKGLLARDMTPKEGYFVFQSYWATKPMVHVYGHDWPVRWGRPGQARIARVYSNCAQVELFVNGVSQGVRYRDSTDFPCAGLRWYPAFRAGQNTVRAVAHADGQRIEDQVSFHYETEPWGAPAKLRLASTGFKPHSQESGRVVLLAELLDAHGKRCLDARQVVRFTVAGDAELLDNLGTTTGSRVVQLANGHIQITALLRTEAVIGVSCDGVAPAFLKLPVGPIVSPAALLEGAPVPRISVAEVSSRTDV